MNRRTFSQTILAFSALSSLGFIKPDSPLNKFEPLKEGDYIGLVCPSGPINEMRLDLAKNNIEKLGFKPLVGKHVLEKYGYLAGADANRVEDLHAMYKDKRVKAIWCIRGGYGATRIIGDLNYNLIKKNPKPIIGYSDITALHQAIFKETGLPSLHGPNASSKLDSYVIDAFKFMSSSKKGSFINNEKHVAETWVEGKSYGTLVGGNLTVLASMCGTPHGLNAKNKIVFLEDIGESPYRIDRMLTQLLAASNLDKANGIILGQFTDCEASAGSQSLSLEECLKDRLLPLNIPILNNVSIGHIDEQFFIPIGCHVSLDASKKEITYPGDFF